MELQLFIRAKEKVPRLQRLIKLQNRCLLVRGYLLTVTKKVVNILNVGSSKFTILGKNIFLLLKKINIFFNILCFTNYLIFKFHPESAWKR